MDNNRMLLAGSTPTTSGTVVPSGGNPTGGRTITTDETVKRVKRQIQGFQVSAANLASPMPSQVLQQIYLPTTNTPNGSLASAQPESLLELLKLCQESGQTMLEAKVADSYRRSIPSSIPLGIDLTSIAQERERLLQVRIASRIQQLEVLQSDSGRLTGLSSAERTRSLLTLKGLKLVNRQRELRETILRVAHQLRSVDSHVERAGLRRGKRQSLREARLTERLEQKQRQDRTKKERQSYYESLQTLLNHARDFQNASRLASQKTAKLVKQVMHLHAYYEKEEQKRIERLSKERIKALRADDEEAYLRLLDQQKDTRITYLLKQTDEFLASLTARVMEQQVVLKNLMTSRSSSDSTLNEDGTTMAISSGVGEGAEPTGTDYYGTAHKIQEIVDRQPRMLTGGKLKDYQLKGLQWMVSLYNNHINGILADEMGLGKTIQAISLISYLIENKSQTGPFLIIVPLSTLTNWSMEFEKWAPSISRIEYKGVPSQRKILQQQLKHGKFNVLLTTYEYIIKDKHALSKLHWLYLIVDEGHRMKNADSKLTTVISRYYHARFRLILTGTPLQNKLEELWALLNFLLPRIFNSCKTFDDWFNTPFANTGEKVELNEEESLLIIRRLHKVLRPFLLRRMKKDVEAELPEKVELVVKCPMSALQQTLYNMVTKRNASAFTDTKSIGIRRLNNTIMQLRKICNHPFVFEEVEQQANPHHVNNELLYRVSGKFELLQRILPKFRASHHRTLIFFQMTQIMTIMEDFLSMQGYAYLRLDGSTKAEDRTELLKKFNAPGSPYFIFLLSTRAGGLGLNLQSADTVIIFDSDWNPHQDLQAQDRAHRIGQTKEVRIFRLITIDSVEEYILEKAQAKLSLDGKVIQAGKFDQKSTNEEREAMLRALFQRENEKNDVEEVYSDDELNEIIARNDDEIELFRKMDEERQKLDQQRHARLGIKQARLIEASELPEIYLNAEADNVEDNGSEDVIPEMRAARARREMVSYDDGLSDEKWLAQLEREATPNSLATPSTLPRKRRTIPMDASPSESESTSTTSRPRLCLTLPRRPPPTPAPSKEDEKGPKAKPPPFISAALHDDLQSYSLDHETLQDMMRNIYDSIENCTELGTSRYRSDLFLELPDREQYPDYYEIIEDPICLSMVENRLEGYHSIQEFMRDLDLLFSNAMRYNVEGSQVYEDAQIMRQLAKDRLDELMETMGRFGEDADRTAEAPERADADSDESQYEEEEDEQEEGEEDASDEL